MAKHTSICTSTKNDNHLSARDVAEMNNSMSGFADSRKTVRGQISQGLLGVNINASDRFYIRVASIQESMDTVNYQHSFSYLKSHLEAIRAANPGTTANLDVVNESAGRHRRLVVSVIGGSASSARRVLGRRQCDGQSTEARRRYFSLIIIFVSRWLMKNA